MPLPEGDTTPREIVQALKGVESSLADFRHEMRNQLQQLVRTDVYRAEQAADRARVATLEKDIERIEQDRSRERDQERGDAGANRRLILAAFGTGIAGIVVALVTAVITAALS
jgi:Flp pilus assembly protein TadB